MGSFIIGVQFCNCLWASLCSINTMVCINWTCPMFWFSTCCPKAKASMITLHERIIALHDSRQITAPAYKGCTVNSKSIQIHCIFKIALWTAIRFCHFHKVYYFNINVIKWMRLHGFMTYLVDSNSPLCICVGTEERFRCTSVSRDDLGIFIRYVISMFGSIFVVHTSFFATRFSCKRCVHGDLWFEHELRWSDLCDWCTYNTTGLAERVVAIE